MELSSIALTGLERAFASFEASAQNVTRAAAPEAPTDMVDLSAAAVEMLRARESVQVNLKMLDTAEDLTQSALDVLA